MVSVGYVCSMLLFSLVFIVAFLAKERNLIISYDVAKRTLSDPIDFGQNYFVIMTVTRARTRKLCVARGVCPTAAQLLLHHVYLWLQLVNI